jgi:hypothetical protein
MTQSHDTRHIWGELVWRLCEDPKPVVFWAHGSIVSKDREGILARPLAESGLVVLALNWADEALAESDVALIREVMEGARCTLRFAAENGAEVGADPYQMPIKKRNPESQY